MTNIVISGIYGKMGQAIFNLARNDSDIKIIAGLEKEGHPMIGKKIPETECRVVGNLNEVIAATEVLIDFTSSEATMKNLEIVHKSGKSIVIGTTGFGDKEPNTIKKLSADIPVVLSPNMSVGVNILFKLVREVTGIIPGYDIEIIEAHHNQKKDAPSGTALKLADEINAALKEKLRIVCGREGIVGPRKPGELGILAVRAGDIVGDHTVIFAGTGERIELVHRAHSRDTFAAGALYAAKWLSGKKPGLYSMQDVLGLASTK